MSTLKDSARQFAVIGEVREAGVDPVVGESVMMAVRVVYSSDRTAASEVPVLFSVRTEETRVDTDGQGWACFNYTAAAPGGVEVIATVGESGERASHTFRFEMLAAGVWDGAQFQLDDGQATIWGEEAGFPRVSQRHIVRLIPTPGSHLIGREICLGLKSYLPASALDMKITPALGIDRPLTDQGLSWECIGTGGGAYALQLAASRILKLSPSNTMSLGAEPDPIPEPLMDARFDAFLVHFGEGSCYPCHGAVHTFKVFPMSSGLIGKQLQLEWIGRSADALGVMVTPPVDIPQAVSTEGIAWTLDCRESTVDGDFALRVKVQETGETTAAIDMSLGHNLVKAERWRTGPFPTWDPDWVYHLSHIRALSKYLDHPVPGVPVQGGSYALRTDSEGEAKAMEVQGQTVYLTIINKYDGSSV